MEPWTKNAGLRLGLLFAVLAFLVACKASVDPGPCDAQPSIERVHPMMAVLPEHKDLLLSRRGQSPWESIFADLEAQAGQEPPLDEGPEWLASVVREQARIARANAFLAWLDGDEAAASKARGILATIRTDLQSSEDWDLNIRLAHPFMALVDASDLLQATPWFPDTERQALDDALAKLATKAYAEYVLDDLMRQATLGFSQNNHPLRTSAAIGYVALFLSERRDMKPLLHWAISETDYLWSERGQYVQTDGGISEGPFYFNFGLSAQVPFLIALDRVWPERACVIRDCINRQDVEPWAGHGCVDGERFSFQNPLESQSFFDIIDWDINLRMGDGRRFPVADSRLIGINGAIPLVDYSGREHWRWDFERQPQEIRWGADLELHHLLSLNGSEAQAPEPLWTTRFLPAAGNAVFRTGWGTDDIVALLLAESGSARMTLHDHVDGTAFALWAFGDYLLLDTGYYKPNEMSIPHTANAVSHNVVLVDGQGAPEKGALTSFGDADAFLKNSLDAAVVDLAEAWQDYQGRHFERTLALVRDRYLVVADAISSEDNTARDHSWRVHGYAGYGNGGTYFVDADGPWFERSSGGVRIHLGSTGGTLSFTEPPDSGSDAPHVHRFESSQPEEHAVVDGTVHGIAPDFLAILNPYRVGANGGDAALNVQSVAGLAAGQVAWLVDVPTGTDLVLLREPDSPTSLTLPDGTVIDTDARLLILGLTDGQGAFTRASYVRVDGQAALSLAHEQAVGEIP